jgi:hypothetical protein
VRSGRSGGVWGLYGLGISDMGGYQIWEGVPTGSYGYNAETEILHF